MKKKLPFLSVLIFCSLIVFSQNQHLNFETGILRTQKISTLPEINITQKGTSEIKLDFSFTGSRLFNVNKNNKKYQHIKIEGLVNLMQVGAPAVPIKNELVAAPKGSEIQLQITDAKYFTYSGFNI